MRAARGILGCAITAFVVVQWILSVSNSLRPDDDLSSSRKVDTLRLDFEPPFHFTYSDCLWPTPATILFEPVLDATIIETGLVYNSTGRYTFNKWYFDRSIHTLSSRDLPLYRDENVYMSFVQIWQDKFQHLAFDTFPRAAYVCSHVMRHEEIKILVVGVLQKEVFRLACPIAESRFKVFESSFSAKAIYVDDYRGKEIDIVSVKGPDDNSARQDGWRKLLYPMGILPRDSIRPLGPALHGSKVVYLPRPQGPRFVKNEDQVVATLKQLFGGALRVYTLQNDWKIDRRAFSDARLVIGPHGGAFGNLIFAPKNTVVVEFLPLTRLKKAGENERPCYLGLAKALGFTYHALEFDSFDFEKEMVVPVPALEMLLEKIAAEDSWDPLEGTFVQGKFYTG